MHPRIHFGSPAYGRLVLRLLHSGIGPTVHVAGLGYVASKSGCMFAVQGLSVDRILVSFSGARSLVDQGTFRLPRLSSQSTLVFQLKHTEQSVCFRLISSPKL